MSDAPKRIIFLDITAPKPYDAESLKNEALGGTEATVIRVAEGLAARGHEVIVAQGVRTEQGQGQANYTSFEALDQIHKDPSVAVALRTPKLIPFIQKRWSDTKLLLWCHDFNLQEIVEDYPILEDTGIKILGVSRTHKSQIADALLSQVKDVKGVTVGFVYNPIADDLTPDPTPVDQNKLVFFSSPHKGLEQTLYMYERVKANFPDIRLYVANPGYIPDYEPLPEGVINLGQITHAEMMQHVRSAFSVFHMNDVFPETFGLVYAEALAVGTPVLTASRGALHEVISNKEFFVNVRDEKAVIDRIEKWRKQGRPVTAVNPNFRLTNVLNEWERLINV